MTDELIVTDEDTDTTVLEVDSGLETVVVLGSDTGVSVVVGAGEGSSTLVVSEEAAPEVLEFLTEGPQGPRGEPGPPGPPGMSSGGITEGVAGEPISALSAVYRGTDGLLYVASSARPSDASALTGVALSSALTNEPLMVRTEGDLEDGVWIPGPYYLGLDGVLTNDPEQGLVQLRIGFAPTTDRLQVRIEPGILHT